MIVAGVMSGTSADGINVALVRIGATRGAAGATHVRTQAKHEQAGPGGGRAALGSFPVSRFVLLVHEEFPYPVRVRRAILDAMNAKSASVADLARMNFLLGELYAEAVAKTARKHGLRPELIGCHGQTLYHQGVASQFLGRKLVATWQTGEGAILAERLRVPVVSDFRPADMAAGGKGAPLVPFLDYLLYRDDRIGRIAQNIGGIANLTAIPARATPERIVAFDTGPGNMVIDAVAQELLGRPYDRNGKVAADGRVMDDVIRKLMRAPFFRIRPPRTAGREQFGREYVKRFLQLCRGGSRADTVATATALTACSIADAVRRFVVSGRNCYRELIVSGGGAKNPTVVAMLRQELLPLAIDLRFSSVFGLPEEAKEAVAFAILAYETWHRRPSNIPSATGARRPAVLGKISYA